MNGKWRKLKGKRRDYLGIILGLFGEYLGLFWEYLGNIWGYFGIILRIFGEYLGVVLRIFWEYFGIVWGLFGDYLGNVLGMGVQVCSGCTRIGFGSKEFTLGNLGRVFPTGNGWKRARKDFFFFPCEFFLPQMTLWELELKSRIGLKNEENGVWEQRNSQERWRTAQVCPEKSQKNLGAATFNIRTFNKLKKIGILWKLKFLGVEIVACETQPAQETPGTKHREGGRNSCCWE